MAGQTLLDGSVVPSFVGIALTNMEADLDEIVGLLHGAEDLDWVSNVANLFQTRLDRLAWLVSSIGTRVDMADIAVRALARRS